MAFNKGSINLLTASVQPQGRWDRIYEWTVNTARYIIIFTELIVLIAIGIRFVFDGQINDLDKEITAQKSILDGRATDEEKVRSLYTALGNLDRLEKNDYTLTTYYRKILNLIPSDIDINNINISISSCSLDGTVNSYDKLLQLEKSIRDADFIVSPTFTSDQKSSGVAAFTVSFKIKFKDDGS